MREEDFSDFQIPYFDRECRGGLVRYADLMIEMGEGRRLSLAECLHEEGEHVREFNQIADRLSQIIKALDPFYDAIDRDPHAYHREADLRRRDLHKLSYSKRVQILNSYYTLNSTHESILRELGTHLLLGSEGDHSAHLTSLIQRAIDMVCRTMRHVKRKTKRAAAVHSIEAARGAAKNGLRSVTIIPTLLHDLLEEELDLWTERLIDRELCDPCYGECSGQSMAQIPIQLRHKIIQKHIDAYNDRASTIYFTVALTLYDHIQNFPQPARYYELLHNIMEILAALSRRRDMSYYSYLKGLLYPKVDAPLDPIARGRLLEGLSEEFPAPERLLLEYERHVQNFYDTALGEFASKDEVRRNAFRELLAKVFDRLNNTRDMERNLGFSIGKRLYATGFKNIFFLQAMEDKLRRPCFNTDERRLLEIKFIHKPKIAALYQCLDDIEHLRKTELGPETIDFLQHEIDRYRGTRHFFRLTPKGKTGYFDGLIYLFNEITLGRKSNLQELDRQAHRQAEALVAFQAILESFLAYPALIREEQRVRGFKAVCQSNYQPYRIVGMGMGLEHRSTARKEQAIDLLNLKTFNRRIE